MYASVSIIYLYLSCALICGGGSASAFVAAPSSGHQLRNININSRHHPTKLLMVDFFADATPSRETTVADQIDVNGNTISPGQRVAIVSHNNIRAHHVSKSSYGSFDATTKQFIPQDESTLTRQTSCLLLPEGLQGEIVNVYNTNEWDRAHPILVKFGLDEERNDGYSLTNPFTMHVDAKEIMVVV
jgi:hypothetical protein